MQSSSAFGEKEKWVLGKYEGGLEVFCFLTARIVLIMLYDFPNVRPATLSIIKAAGPLAFWITFKIAFCYLSPIACW